MQTFLPLPDFAQSAAVLDYRRLGKQRVEAQQILNSLLRGGGWQQHPAVRMWRGYEYSLVVYRNTMINEWVSRGFRNAMDTADPEGVIVHPPWLHTPAFHASHRSNLLRKDPDHYGQFGWVEPANLDYVWPV